jgi:hypothetical protein
VDAGDVVVSSALQAAIAVAIAAAVMTANIPFLVIASLSIEETHLGRSAPTPFTAQQKHVHAAAVNAFLRNTSMNSSVQNRSCFAGRRMGVCWVMSKNCSHLDATFSALHRHPSRALNTVEEFMLLTTRAIRRWTLAALFATVQLASVTANSAGQLKVSGRGKTQALVRAQFSPPMRKKYDLFARKCTRCHAMSRPISALNTGITPVSGNLFEEKYIKKYVVKMMRKPKSGIAKGSAKEILQFLVYARGLARASD